MLHKEIEAKLKTYQDPYLKTDLITAKAIKGIEVKDNEVLLKVVLNYPYQTGFSALREVLTALLAPLLPEKTLTIDITSHIDAHTGNQGMAALPQVKNIIAVGSGKGGVGKSTVSVNIALALAREGARVGLLDADIYGPSQPAMVGAKGEKPNVIEGKLQPIIRHGLQTMSIGYLIDETAPMVWRGPMLGKALQQLLQDTAWDTLDYLIVDLPPGTGDIQLTLCQKMPLSGTVMVTTPQDLALLDVRRACEMFKKLNIPILGVIENMSSFHCSHCGHTQAIFGQGGGAHLAAEYQFNLLQSIPLDLRIREMTDAGSPPVVQDPESDYAKAFSEAARYMAATLAKQTKDYSARFPKIVVKHDKKEE